MFDYVSILQVIFCIIAFILHLISISTLHWFDIKQKPRYVLSERIVYSGLWLFCRVEHGKGEICVPFEYEHFGTIYIGSARVLVILAAITIPIYILITIINQSSLVYKNSIKVYSNFFKWFIATVSFGFTLLAMYFSSVVEGEMPRQFQGFVFVFSWSFYLEAFVTLILFVLLVMTSIEIYFEGDSKIEQCPSQLNIEQGSSRSNIKEASIQPNIEKDKFQPSIQENQIQSIIEEVQIRPNIDEDQIRSNIEKYQIQLVDTLPSHRVSL